MVKTRNQKRKDLYDNAYETDNHKKIKFDEYVIDSETDETDETDATNETNEQCDTHYTENNNNNDEEDELSKLIVKELINKIKNKEKGKEKKNNESEEDKYNELVDNIYSGNFFYNTSSNESKSIKKDDMITINKELEKIQNEYFINTPKLVDILKKDIPVDKKKDLLEKYFKWANSDVLSNEWFKNLKYINWNIETKDDTLMKLEMDILDKVKHGNEFDDYKTKILKSNMNFDNKVKAYSKMNIMEGYDDSDGEYSKYKTWIDLLLSIPFGEYADKGNVDLTCIRNTLDKKIAFMEKPKDQILNIVAHKLRNPDYKINAIGLYGEKGLGKSKFVSAISESLNKPYTMISLGGESDASTLNGHNFTYVGSTPGRIIDSIIRNGCMDSIILFDELDKVSESHHGKEIIGTLIHLTDTTTNSNYNYDRYFSGITFDLSKTLFVFTYNDHTKIDPILLDRIYKIKIDDYTFKEKLEIANNYILKEVLENFKFTTDDIRFDKDALEYIIKLSTTCGMRDIYQKIYIIISRINTLLLNNKDIIKLDYIKLLNDYNKLPVNIKREHIDIFLKDSTDSDKGTEVPFGMYL